MTQQELKIGMRVYHPIFLWGTVRLPPNTDKTFVDFDFKECSYYIMGEGYRTFKKQNGDNGVYLPNDELFEKEISGSEIPAILSLKKKALNATVIM